MKRNSYETILIPLAKQRELLEIISNDDRELLIIPFVFFTANNFVNRTSHFLLANPSMKNPYLLILNEYYLLFSFNSNELQENFQILNNTDNSNVKVGFFSSELWESLRKDNMNFITQLALRNLKQNNKEPWIQNGQ